MIGNRSGAGKFRCKCGSVFLTPKLRDMCEREHLVVKELEFDHPRVKEAERARVMTQQRMWEVAIEERIQYRALLWAAWRELNAIRARDGVPYTHEGWKCEVSEEYFSALVDALDAALGEDAKPWPSKVMKPFLAVLDVPWPDVPSD